MVGEALEPVDSGSKAPIDRRASTLLTGRGGLDLDSCCFEKSTQRWDFGLQNKLAGMHHEKSTGTESQ
jgi:hypothetical protein